MPRSTGLRTVLVAWSVCLVPGPTEARQGPETNPANHPTREVIDHFFAMEVVWR